MNSAGPYRTAVEQEKEAMPLWTTERRLVFWMSLMWITLNLCTYRLLHDQFLPVSVAALQWHLLASGAVLVSWRLVVALNERYRKPS